MNCYRVLLFEGRARQSLPLAQAFKKNGCHVTALCESKLDVSYASRNVDKKILSTCQKYDETGTIEQICSIVKSEGIQLIVPTTDFSAMLLSKHKAALLPFCSVAVNDWDVFQLAADKNKTMEICMKEGLPCPRTLLDVDCLEKAKALPFPIVVKPKTGYGAIGFRCVQSDQELEQLFGSASKEELSKLVFQEYIPQTELQYECAMFMDDHDEAKTALVFSKNRWFPVEGGSSTLNITVERQDIVESCTKLLRTIHWRGAADIDLIQDPRDGKAKIMEINPRVSGSVKIAFLAGVDQAKQMIEAATGAEVTAYPEYTKGLRLRCLQTDFLWFMKSRNRFHANPSWFSWRKTKEQVFSWDDPIPWFAFTLQGLLRYKKEMEKRS